MGDEEHHMLGLGLHMQELDDLLINLPVGFRARIGLNETALTRALARGEFSEAERLITEATDPEFLNDGALAATPLNMVLTGRSSYYHQSRNLKLAHLLLQKGANPNLRIPNHDMESASQSPLELLLRYYLKLVDVFGLPGSCRTSYCSSSFDETELMDTIGINGEDTGLGPNQVTCQARFLLLFCLDNGGDPRGTTTDGAKSIFHMAVTAPVLDVGLVEKLLEIGVNINIADVHNNSPMLDIINLGDEARSLSSLSLLESRNQTVILDLENCSRQSAVWRSVHQGHTTLTLSLLARAGDQTVLTSTGARVEPAVSQVHHQSHHRRITCLVPPLLAPLLSDSPCSTNLHVTTARRRQAPVSFSIQRSQHVVRQFIAPCVDSGDLQSAQVLGQVPGPVSSLVNSQTDHSCAGDSSVVDSNSLLPLMFGELSAGLRQLAARAILSTILFDCSPEQANKRLDKVCETQGFMLTQLFVKPSLSKPKQSSEPSMSYEYEIELGNEMELSFGRRNLDDSDDGIEIAISDKSSSDSPSEAASDLMDTIAKLDRELETIKTECELDSLDRDLANWESELVATLDRIQTYHAELGSLDTVQMARRRSEELMEELRLQRLLLDSSSRELEEVENSVASMDFNGMRSESSERSRRRLDDNWSLGAARFLAAEEKDAEEDAEEDTEAEEKREESSAAVREHIETLVQTLTVAATYNEQSDEEETDSAAPPAPAVGRIRSFLRTPLPRLAESDERSDWDSESDDSSESDTWGGTFSLRHTRGETPGTVSGLSQASIVARLSPRTLFALTDYIGIPHSLRPVFSVEAARLQLCLALHSHRSINCDRNCEGEESDTEDSETEDWLHTDTDTEDNTEDEADIAPNLTDSDHSHTYDDEDQSSDSSLSNFSQRSWYGSLPQIPGGRQLTPLSTPPDLTQSEDSDSEAPPSHSWLEDGEAPSHSWLEDREDYSRVRQFLESGPGPDFNHSTDSESLSE